MCNFCGRYDTQFNPDSIDLHYWKECPMLGRCRECDQVVEQQLMAAHLLEECEFRNRYQRHEKCNMPVLKSESALHRCDRPKPAGAARCYECGKDVFPNTNAGWKQHILVDKCDGNKRPVVL